MKELSIEEKAKHYDEALKVLHKYDGANIMFSQSLKEEMFPELRESEDERIRKELICFLETEIPQCNARDKYIAWLEKQGEHDMGISEVTKQELKDNLNKALAVETGESWNEFLDEHKPMTGSKFKVGDKVVHKGTGKLWTVHWYIKEDNVYSVEDSEGLINIYSPDVLELVEQKPANKVKPKFKVDNWVVYNDNVYQIHNISLEKYYECLRIDGTVHTFDFEYIDSKSHLWTIQDAKDGDVLVYENDIVIFKENNYNPKNQSGCMFVYCSCNNFYEIGGINPTAYKPATKEQCDTLFAKMKEAGYEWDAKKKELKKIEQNSTDEIGNYDHEEVLQTIINEQKPAWSEEDEDYRNDVNVAVEDYFDEGYAEELRDWLKSLKERIKPQWKPSDEQMKALKEACDEHWEPDGLDPLYTLWEQLKKLREE